MSFINNFLTEIDGIAATVPDVDGRSLITQCRDLAKRYNLDYMYVFRRVQEVLNENSSHGKV